MTASNLDLDSECRSGKPETDASEANTIVYVTRPRGAHAFSKIAMMNHGQSRADLLWRQYERHPHFVAEFTGNPQTNFLDAKVVRNGNSPYLAVGDTVLWPAQPGWPDQVVLAIRPEGLTLCNDNQPGRIPAAVYATLPVGPSVLVYADSNGIEIVIRADRGTSFQGNQQVWLELDRSQINIYDAETGKRIGDDTDH